MRIASGIGYDTHQLVEGRRLVIGGVEIESSVGLLGHSDADVLTHAIIDALLGAAALGDIGEHFPDTDERYRDADSLALARETVAMIGAEGWRIEHVDCTVLLERPKLAPHRVAIKATLCDALGVSLDRLNVKATRGEGMGPVGRGEGAVAMAVATLSR